jgi:Fe/S biogenesis protein NfuA
VVVPAASIEDLQGATLDLPRHSDQGGLVLRNPNRPKTPQLGEDIELTGTPEEKIRQLLDQQVNPAIAAHGGRVDLVAVDDSIAYVRLSGGCQGCGMASVTLSQGVEAEILDSVPEISEVIDVTDHASGANPYYEAAKK